MIDRSMMSLQVPDGRWEYVSQVLGKAAGGRGLPAKAAWLEVVVEFRNVCALQGLFLTEMADSPRED